MSNKLEKAKDFGTHCTYQNNDSKVKSKGLTGIDRIETLEKCLSQENLIILNKNILTDDKKIRGDGHTFQ